MRELSVAEQRYQAVMAVISDGLSVSQVAEKVGVSRQTLRERDPLNAVLRNANGIKRHVDSSHLLDNGVEMTCRGVFVESINLGGLGQPTGRRDFFGELGECAGVSSGEKYPGTFSSESTRHRATHGASRTVDDRILVFEKHCRS